MNDINLQPNERIIYQEEGVAKGNLMSAYVHALILTNQNIICVNKNVFGSIKSVETYPLREIKIIDERPQVYSGRKSNGEFTLEIALQSGVQAFSFQGVGKTKVVKWINLIYRELVGHDSDEKTLVGSFTDVAKNITSTGASILGETVGSLIGSFKDSINLEEKTTTITKKCVSCHAPISGEKGQLVKCKYCDTKQTL